MSRKGQESKEGSDWKSGRFAPRPITIDGEPLVMRDTDGLFDVTPEELQVRVLFLNKAVSDLALNEHALDNGCEVMSLIDRGWPGWCW